MYSLRVQRNTVTSQREFTFILLQTKEEQNEENENTAANAAAPRAASQRSPDTESPFSPVAKANSTIVISGYKDLSTRLHFMMNELRAEAPLAWSVLWYTDGKSITKHDGLEWSCSWHEAQYWKK